MRVNTAGRLHPDHLRKIGFVGRNHFFGQTSCLHDLSIMVDIVQESVDRPHPLLDSTRQFAPFIARDDTRDNVEGDQTFFGLCPAIDIEGNAGQAKNLFSLALLGAQACGVFFGEPFVEILVWAAKGRIMAPHLIECFPITHERTPLSDARWQARPAHLVNCSSPLMGCKCPCAVFPLCAKKTARLAKEFGNPVTATLLPAPRRPAQTARSRRHSV